MSLLKSPLFPDPSCDRGLHAFHYALMPHAGDWRDAGVDHAADCLREPLRAGADDPMLTGLIADYWQQRNDRYSQSRHAATATTRQKIEMSYIGG